MAQVGDDERVDGGTESLPEALEHGSSLAGGRLGQSLYSAILLGVLEDGA